MALKDALLIADVAHQRLLPKRHALSYTVYYLCFPISCINKIATAVLSLNRFNIFGFYESDHGINATNCQTWIREVLMQHSLTEADGEIILLTMPRVLGYAFNPVSFWFCLDKAGALRAVLSEVNNTFGERHCYLSYHDDHRTIKKDDWLESRKVFHVSPFLEVKGSYRFRFAYSEAKIGAWIDYYVDGQNILMTSLVGKRQMLNDSNLLICFFRYPLVTLKVIFLIHLHALRLVLKGIRYHNKAPLNTEEITR